LEPFRQRYSARDDLGHASRSGCDDALGLDARPRRIRFPSAQWTDINTDPDANCYCCCNCYCYCNGNCYCYGNCYGNCYCNCYCNSYAHAYALHFPFPERSSLPICKWQSADQRRV